MLSWWLAGSAAFACGGFFCDGFDPVDQAGEIAVFEVDDDAGLVRMHVRVSWEGNDADFAWVVPVPANPDLFLSTDALFTALDAGTRPYFAVRNEGAECFEADADTDADSDTDSDADADVDPYGTSWGGVEVVSMQTVGPYDSAILTATDSADLVGWLQGNGYAVPNALEPLLLPYLGADTHFLALKLTTGASAGDLTPLGLTYAGDTPAIPIQLTAVASVPDMPMTVYLLGPARGVPLNYLHVQLNPFAHPWFFGMEPFDTVSGRGADEAGGQAFTTAFAGPSSVASVWSPGRFDVDGLDAETVPVEWFESLGTRGFSGTAELLDVLRRHVPAPADVEETSFYNCTGCYADDWAALADTFDPVAATADLVATIVTPREEAQAVLDRNPWLTRLVSTMSADEMTIDPRFGFNPDLPEVDRLHYGTLRYDCDDGNDRSAARRSLELPDGWQMWVPSEDEAPNLGAWVSAQIGAFAWKIERFSESGPGELIVDNTDRITRDALTASRPNLPGADPLAEEAAAGGCGCDTGAGLGGAGAVVTGLLLASRRRRVR